MRDLDSRTEIRELVVRFYRDVAADDLLGPVFLDVAHVDWTTHIPKLVDYWCRVLLREPVYDGAFLGPHERVHARQPLERAHFDRWYELWVEAVDSGWTGPFADAAKRHAARNMATLAKHLLGIVWVPPHLVEDEGGDPPCWAHELEAIEDSHRRRSA